VKLIYLELASLYVLAEFLQDPKTKNMLLDAIISQARRKRSYKMQNLSYHLPQIETIQVMYDGTPSSSLARQLLVELYDSQNVNHADFKGWDDIPIDFVEELSNLQHLVGSDRYAYLDPTDESRYDERIPEDAIDEQSDPD
jgi:hypothetical protein